MVRLVLLGGVSLLAALAAEVPGEWPRWRGPFDNGTARGAAPWRWSDTENIAWKIAVPGKGHSSPVIWGDRLFLTTAVPTDPSQPGQAAPPAGGGGRPNFGQGAQGEQPEHKLMVQAYDRKTGKLLWEKVARTVKPHEGYHRRYGSFASNSPVTDGKRLYVFFGSNGVFCYDLNGKLIWERDPGVKLRMRNAFGEGTAAVIDGETLYLNFDHEGESFLLALDKNTGKDRWKVDRKEISNWAPPLVVEHEGQRQVVVAAPNKVRSYDAKDGSLIWECAGLGANTIPAPVTANGIVYVMSGYRDPNLLAIKLGRKGDLTGTDAVLWSTNKGTSYTASPVLADGKLYMLTDSGMLTCLDAATGKPYYERVRLPKPYNFKASPVAIDGKLYLSSEEGDVIVVKMGETFEVLATNTLAEQSFIASPAVAQGDLYLRTQTHLFCVREAKK
ncbi:MAG: PQQ-binding-like beta-propeller repeat protein [Bryobacteraceae bacterium]|nr:PQQ-binding-like beta-propeller repeat protein [Bryobacteraceae bacterium]